MIEKEAWYSHGTENVRYYYCDAKENSLCCMYYAKEESSYIEWNLKSSRVPSMQAKTSQQIINSYIKRVFGSQIETYSEKLHFK